MKKSIALLISFLMVLTLLPAVALAADVTEWSEVTGSGETKITLLNDVTITEENNDLTGKTVTFSGTATISGNVTITGGEILRGADNKGALFKVGSGSSLTLSNIKVDGQKSNVKANMPLVDISSGGTVTLGKGATLTNNKSNGGGEGSAVTVDGGTLNITGGSITNNESTTDAGSTIKTYYGATVTMTDGEISGNSGAKHGGAIQLYGRQRISENNTSTTTFTMSGGTISGNTANVVGGGVAVSDYSSFIMKGGEIKNNSTTDSQKRGGGVWFGDSYTTMKISGSATITGNTADGIKNNLYIGMKTNNQLEITGALSGTIGITRPSNKTGDVFTSTTSSVTPSTYITQFSSDNTSYYVADNGSGQLLLKEKKNTITISTNLSETAAAGTTLTVSASADDATVSYKWYSCTGVDKSGAEAISGATNFTYTVPTDLSAGDHYYFCRVSADGAASVDSNVVKVTVEEPAVVEAKWGNSSSALTNSGTLSAAFAASPAYIQLQAPVKLGSGITMTSGTITLDLNGQTITGAAGINTYSPNGVTPITVNGGTLTLIDSVGGGGITGGNAAAASSSGAGYGLEVENGTLKIGDGTSTGGFTLTGGDASRDAKPGLYIASGGTVTVNQAFSVKAGKRGDSYVNAISSHGTFNGNSKVITATGGISIADGSATDLNATVTDATDALTVSNATKVTITGGSYTGSRYGLWLRSTPTDDVTISGGTFVGNTSDNKQAIHVNSNNTYAGILADGYIYTNGENDNAITDETALAAATKLVIKKGGSSTEYSVVVSVEGTGGTANGGGTYIVNETATVTATAKTGYRFVKWTENGNEVSTDAAYSFAVTADRTLVAVFEREPVNPPIYTAPSITAQPQNKSIKVGETATFTVAATGTPEPTYQWQIDRGDGNGWVNISGATQASYTTSAVSLDNSGYKYRCVITNSAGSVTSGEALLTVTEDGGEKIIVEPKINEDFDDGDIPQALKDEGLNTVEKIDEALKLKIENRDSDIKDTELYDVVLMYSTDGGATWTKADKSHFPASGELPVQLPVPDGTDPETHEYIVAHMFTSDAFGKRPGDVEYPDVTEKEINGKWYLEFNVTGLSPISVGWKTTGTTPVTTYTVTYTDGVGGAVFANQVYDNLTAGTPTPAFNGTPSRSGFTFTGWSPSVAATVTSDATYTAQWRKNSTTAGSDSSNSPAITSPTTDQEVFVYVNSNATMSIDAKDAKTYQWYVDRGNGFEAISGATDASYTTSKVELKNDGYRYYCVATNAYGTDISPIFTLNVTKDIVTPKTGDNAQNGLWTGLIMIAAAGLCACTVVWRKRSQA